MRLLRRDRLVCRRAVELIADYLDDELSRGDRHRLEFHLKSCPHCSEYLRQMRATLAAAGNRGTAEPEPEVAASLAQMYRDWLAGG
jgi:anti-sigma factor RsiW